MAEVDITVNKRSYRISCKDGEEERITVAFDIKSADFYKQDVFDDAKSHWVKI